MRELITTNKSKTVRVCLLSCGEKQPDGTPLVRFFVNDKVGRTWMHVPHGSYCTLIPEATPRKELTRLAKVILRRVAVPVRKGRSIASITARLAKLAPRSVKTKKDAFRKWNVFLYPVLRVKVPVEADSPEKAIAKAEALVAGTVEAVVEGTKRSPIPGVEYITYDESDTGEALVEDTRDPPKFTRWYENQHNGDSFPWRPKV